MVIFVIGGSGSGKSEYAENRAVSMKNRANAEKTANLQSQEAELIYIATMEPQDLESKKRIERHQKMRAEKHFTTCECYTHLEELTLRENDSEKRYITLLECLSNLTANEMFSSKGRNDSVVPVIKKGILHLIEQSKDVIIVGNNVFEDGIQYDETTEIYLKQMAELHCFLAERADEVIEVICGIPLFWKGGTHEVY